jgi:uncharacterized protein (DUF4415 family)
MENLEMIDGTIENWESGALGRSFEHARPVSKEMERELDEARGLQAISIRLNKALIDDFKFIAKFHGRGYQPLMRDALRRFAESEIKKIAVALANEKEAREEELRESVAGAQAEAEQSRENPHERRAA